MGWLRSWWGAITAGEWEGGPDLSHPSLPDSAQALQPPPVPSGSAQGGPVSPGS